LYLRLLFVLCFCSGGSQAADAALISNCSLVISLQRSAHDVFANEVEQLQDLLRNQHVRLLDLESWQREAPYVDLSGRERHQIRELYNVSVNTNQVLVINREQQLVQRLTGSVSLVDALMACPP
jgi:hypothetical protein